MTTISRVSAGNPTGGQFAGNTRTEADTNLLTVDDITIVRLESPDARGGFDEIHTWTDGSLAYFRDGKLHNEAGPAMVEGHDTDPSSATQMAWLDGEALIAPEADLYFYGVQEDVNGVKQQLWTTGCNTVVYVDPDGRQTFTNDGDIDRAGAPAITGGTGPDLWIRHGKLINNPIPAIPTATPCGDGDATYIEYQGEKFESGASTAERAKRIREDIDKAIYAGTLGTDVGLLTRVKVTTLGKPGVEGKPQALHVVYQPTTRATVPYVKRGADGSNELTDEGRKVSQMMTDIVDAHNRWEYGPGATDARCAFNTRVEIV